MDFDMGMSIVVQPPAQDPFGHVRRVAITTEVTQHHPSQPRMRQFRDQFGGLRVGKMTVA